MCRCKAVSSVLWILLQSSFFARVLGNFVDKVGISLTTSVYVNRVNETFIADFRNCSIRKFDEMGVTSISFGAKNSGTCKSAGDGGLAMLASGQPFRVCGDSHTGDLYFTDYFSRTVRRISESSGVVSTIAGSATKEGHLRKRSNVGTTENLFNPSSCQVGRFGDVYVIDEGLRIVKITPVNGELADITEGLRTEDGKSVSSIPHPEDFYLNRVTDTLYIVSRTEGLLIICSVSDPLRRTLRRVPPIYLGSVPSIIGNEDGHVYLLNNDSGAVFLFDGVTYTQLPDEVVSYAVYGLVVLYGDLALSLHDSNLHVARKQFLAHTATASASFSKPEI